MASLFYCRLLGLWLLASALPLLVEASNHHDPYGHFVHHDLHHDVSSRVRRNASSSTAANTTHSLISNMTTVVQSNSTTQLFNVSDLTMFSSDCANALAGPLNCSSLIGDPNTIYNWNGLTMDDVTTLCTTACTDSIANFRANMLDSCANEVYTDEPQNATTYVYGTGQMNDIYNVEGISVKAIALADYYFLGYNLTCMQDNSNPPNYCAMLAVNSNGTAVDPCGPCNLGAMREQLEDGRTYNDALASEYSASVSSCGVTAPPLTTPTPVFLSDPNTVVANYSATPTCTGSYVAIPTGSTCDGFAEANSIGTDQLLMLNGLVAGCANWPGNLTSLCVQGNCDPYLVQQNDTCISVAAAHKITLSQLLSWNPTIDPICDNFHTKIGHVICVSSPAGWTAANFTDVGAAPTVPTTAAPVPTNAMNGTNTYCGAWYVVQPGEYCALITLKNGISLSDFYFLNPEINSNCTNLWANEAYCIEAVGDISTYPGYLGTATPTTTQAWTTDSAITWSSLPTATAPVYPNVTATATPYPLANGSLTNCFEMFDNTYGEITCFDAAELFGVPVTDFIRWNPSVLNGANYTLDGCLLANNTEYCGSFYNQSLVPSSTVVYPPIPTDATANATTDCMDWYETGTGDTCDMICQVFDIPFSSLYQWNPAIGPDCASLWINASYCVAGPGWANVTYNMTTTTTATTTGTATLTGSTTTGATTTTGTGAPAPTQSGVVANCQEWYVAQSGDSCSGIATNYNISLSQFYAWNPAVGSSCTSLIAGDAYCVEAPTTISSSTTTTPVPSTTTTTTTSSTTTSVTPPAPTQSGIPSNCDAYAVAQSGDGCETFATRNNITLDELYQWNPVLNNDCENFWSGEAYCIGVSS